MDMSVRHCSIFSSLQHGVKKEVPNHGALLDNSEFGRGLNTNDDFSIALTHSCCVCAFICVCVCGCGCESPGRQRISGFEITANGFFYGAGGLLM